MALYRAKAAGKDGYVLFEFEMQTAARDAIHLEMDLGDALKAEELFVLYQPMLDLETEQVVGVEALLRWCHPTRGVIAPDVFIPIAEDGGLIIAIGRWVLHQACAQTAAWHRRATPSGSPSTSRRVSSSARSSWRRCARCWPKPAWTPKR